MGNKKLLIELLRRLRGKDRKKGVRAGGNWRPERRRKGNW